MDLFNRLFSKQPPSKDIAKERLKLILVHDRANCLAPISGDD